MPQRKEYHLFLYIPDYIATWDITVGDVDAAVSVEKPIINTFQVITCKTDLFRHGYRIFVHSSPDCCYEIKLGQNNCGREIRMGHCIYKMILAGQFDNV